MEPKEIYVIFNKVKGSYLVGGGSSTKPVAKIFPTRKKAESSISRFRYDQDDYVVERFIKVEENHG